MAKSDVERLAAHLDMSVKDAKKRFTRKDKDETRFNGKGARVLRHQDDEIFGTICTFFDRKARRCGIYEIRPQACRDYPGLRHCGYYEFLRFERRAQNDPEYVALTGN